ncbi:phospholipase D family protein [Synechocystis sp. PCC 7339]|uniref:phospholipase D family protein n=1 Tax=unclassified Synechocystis TaxID=2640012 RepID=UPI001BAF5BC6|nr:MULTISPECIES: phospholipase D family protein [unclassified Synechocystis]QUS61579.1 hypothetical protein HTZ78_13540 [Synechocystis sp. PCC 7338]UAJ73776.1 phospholipase D family protein [Synechocystis sp. PCC 7339]
MYQDLGNNILSRTDNTKIELVLVAPFIKQSVLSQILDKTSENIDLIIVTRWIPEEILGGVSDIEIWNLINDRERSQLFLCQYLHAKYYRFDDLCLLGSANLTNRGLGFNKQSNLELLICCSFTDKSLQDFEENLISQSFLVTQDIYETYKNMIENIDIKIELNSPSNFSIFEVNPNWIPLLRNPQELYLAYSDQWERLTTTGKELAKQELEYLSFTQGLSEKNFNLYIALALKQTPIIQYIDKHLDKPRRFGEMKNIIDHFLTEMNLSLDSSHTWQTLMRWLLYFLPDCYSYKVFNYSEVFYRCKK